MLQVLSSHFIRTARASGLSATTVRVRNGQVTMTDGPFAETKEMLAGFYLVDAKDLNEAVQIAQPLLPEGAAMEPGARVTGRPPAFSRAAVGYVLRHGGFDISRTRAVLGYAPRVTLDQGLAEIGRRYRAGLGA